jgi:hypothetical protein
VVDNFLHALDSQLIEKLFWLLVTDIPTCIRDIVSLSLTCSRFQCALPSLPMSCALAEWCQLACTAAGTSRLHVNGHCAARSRCTCSRRTWHHATEACNAVQVQARTCAVVMSRCKKQVFI